MDEMAWLVEATGESEEQHYDSQGRITFEDGPFSGFIERIQVRSGIALYRVEGMSSHAWRLKALGDSPAGNLVFGTMLDGAGAIEAKGNERQAWRGGGRPFVLSLAEREIAYHLEAGKRWAAVTLLLEPEALDLLAAQDGLPPVARQVLEDGRKPLLQLYELDKALARTAQELLQPTYGGAMGALWRESKALELLTYQMDRQLGTDAMAPTGLPPRELVRIREAHERLVADLRSPPGLEQLSAAVGLSPRRLNQGFRQVYGMTVFEALLEARMQAAHAMIRDGLDIPLKHLAWTVGYNQLSNFINAYRRRFGVPPGRHRRAGDRT